MVKQPSKRNKIPKSIKNKNGILIFWIFSAVEKGLRALNIICNQYM